MNLIFLAIIIGEIAFWIFLVSGLLLRYVWGLNKLSIILLASTPLIDIFLLIITFIDLSNGTKPHFFHGLSATYIGFSITYGHKTIKWADQWAAYKWASGERPEKKKLHGKEKVKYQWREFSRFFVCAVIILTLVGIAFFIVPFEDTFWLIYWVVNIIGTVIIWLVFGPVKSILNNK
ncbi:hypothetical protein [Paenibacillus sp. OSY-SE]|uniref:hypothetical protein n=1 Tax=Paenibacillus sp. OSY-SE TaxID=1196323 RepID=UPI00036E865D|nr:hypothetical protein [Paenibacillus sp. OSY-SE]